MLISATTNKKLREYKSRMWQRSLVNHNLAKVSFTRAIRSPGEEVSTNLELSRENLFTFLDKTLLSDRDDMYQTAALQARFLTKDTTSYSVETNNMFLKDSFLEYWV